jgi:cyclase
MLKARVIPTLLWKGAGLVKGVAFDSWRRVGTVLPAIKVYNTREVDELVLLDITATREQREPDYESVAEYSAECFVPLTVGGGVRALEHMQKLLEAGADKVAINSAAYDHPELVQQGSRQFGSQCMVVSVDVRRYPDGRYECFRHCGQTPTGQEPVAWAKHLEALGAGEILLTRVERDGTFEGYDLELVEQVARAVNIPVIASGGAGTYAHMLAALQRGAAAVAAASMFHFTEQTPKEAKAFLASHGIPVRQTTPL